MSRGPQDHKRTKGKRVRCQALSDHGKLCARFTTSRESFYGDSELLERPTTWVLVALCEEHTNREAR